MKPTPGYEFDPQLIFVVVVVVVDFFKIYFKNSEIDQTI